MGKSIDRGASTECHRERARRKTGRILLYFEDFWQDVSREHARPRSAIDRLAIPEP